LERRYAQQFGRPDLQVRVDGQQDLFAFLKVIHQQVQDLEILPLEDLEVSAVDELEIESPSPHEWRGCSVHDTPPGNRLNGIG
jgi:hypothetical protein